jgi:predicted sugar kinase
MNHVNSGSVHATTDRVHATTGRVHATIGRVPGTIGRVPRTIGRVPSGKMSEEIAMEYHTRLTPYRVEPDTPDIFHR